ncbi:MAG: recombination mediator RecR [Chitinophagaceae bacterium]
MMQLPSILLENAVAEFAKLPGIGKKTALRLVLHLLKEEEDDVKRFSQAIERMRTETHFCQECFNISDGGICAICTNRARNHQLICVVENIRDVIAIENTQQFNGVYHVLGGVISPLDGIGPEQLHIEELIARVQKDVVQELVFALNPNIQGDTTIFYIQRKLKDINCKVTTISRGIAFGGELEYADEMTLGRSLANRLPVENYVK